MKKITEMSKTPQTTVIVSEVNRNSGDSITDHKGLVEPVLGYPGEYSQGVPSKIVRANCR
jgi:hypothetical protein